MASGSCTRIPAMSSLTKTWHPSRELRKRGQGKRLLQRTKGWRARRSANVSVRPNARSSMSSSSSQASSRRSNTASGRITWQVLQASEASQAPAKMKNGWEQRREWFSRLSQAATCATGLPDPQNCCVLPPTSSGPPSHCRDVQLHACPRIQCLPCGGGRPHPQAVRSGCWSGKLSTTHTAASAATAGRGQGSCSGWQLGTKQAYQLTFRT